MLYIWRIVKSSMCVTNVLSNELMCYQNREVKILNDLNDLDLNDRI